MLQVMNSDGSPLRPDPSSCISVTASSQNGYWLNGVFYPWDSTGYVPTFSYSILYLPGKVEWAFKLAKALMEAEVVSIKTPKDFTDMVELIAANL